MSSSALHSKRITALTAISLAVGVLVIAGCGSDSNKQAAGTDPVSNGTPTEQVAPTPKPDKAFGTSKSQQSASGSPATTKGKSTAGKESASSGQAAVASERVASAGEGSVKTASAVPKGPNPCALVSQSDAEAVLGSPILHTTEAPLGPTCIFKLKSAPKTVTLAVERIPIASQVKLMHKPQRLTLSGHAAYCGTLGREMLYLSLGDGKVLNVTAPCSAAPSLAAKALANLKL